jgi:hypothetical protein
MIDAFEINGYDVGKQSFVHDRYVYIFTCTIHCRWKFLIIRQSVSK